MAVLYDTSTESLAITVRDLIIRIQFVGGSSTNSHNHQMIFCGAFGQ